MIYLVPDLMQLQMDLQELANDAQVLRDRVAALVARQQKAEQAAPVKAGYIRDIQGVVVRED